MTASAAPAAQRRDLFSLPLHTTAAPHPTQHCSSPPPITRLPRHHPFDDRLLSAVVARHSSHNTNRLAQRYAIVLSHPPAPPSSARTAQALDMAGDGGERCKKDCDHVRDALEAARAVQTLYLETEAQHGGMRSSHDRSAAVKPLGICADAMPRVAATASATSHCVPKQSVIANGCICPA